MMNSKGSTGHPSFTLDPPSPDPGSSQRGGSSRDNGTGATGHLTPASIQSMSAPPTPGERSDQEGFYFAPKRAMASFENLVAMANHQERLKEARKMVWRDRGQPVVEVDDLEACLAHAMSGGFSKFR